MIRAVHNFFIGLGLFASMAWILFWILCIPGWIMNFQNLWEYAPASGMIADVSLRWVLSVIGIFCFPLGGITGWIW